MHSRNVKITEFGSSKNSIYLFYVSIIKQHPFATLGVKGKGTIMSACVANHSHKKKFTVFGIFICNPIKQL